MLSPHQKSNIERGHGISMVSLSVDDTAVVEYTVNLRVIGMMCQRNCGKILDLIEIFTLIYLLY